MSSKTTINKTLLKQLTELSRLKLTVKEEDQFIKDLRKIINYFEEIKSVDTSEVKPMTGGHLLKNVFREDKIDFSKKAQSTDEVGLIIDSFPDDEKGYLKTVKVL